MTQKTNTIKQLHLKNINNNKNKIHSANNKTKQSNKNKTKQLHLKHKNNYTQHASKKQPE